MILEEIRMRDDTPDDLVHDLFAGALFPRHPLGREIAGSQETITAMTRDADRRVPRATHYQPVERRGRGRRQPRARRRRGAWSRPRCPTARPRATRCASSGADAGDPSRSRVLERPLEQAHVVLGMRALRRDDPDRFALAVVDQVLGGGMSSRLFQEVREKRGLAYSVFSYRERVRGDRRARRVLRHRARARRRGARRRATASSTGSSPTAASPSASSTSAKGHLTGSLALSLESSSSRMHRIGRSRAHARRGPDARRGGRAGRSGHRRRRRAG